MNISIRARCAAAVIGLLLVAVTVVPAQAQNFGNSIKIQRVVFPVTLTEGPVNVVGYLYYHGSYEDRPLQVLLHGATYNHTYWDFPAINEMGYSYARYMAVRKYAVLAIDMPGAGESDRPNGETLTLSETGEAIRQILTALRNGSNPINYSFNRIALVGHSAGSINATYVQANWSLADALVVTASRHLVGPVLEMPQVAGLMPTLQALVGTFAPYPYFQLPATYRTLLFYHQPAADPDVIAHDNANMDQWTNGQLLTTFFAFLNPALDTPDRVTGPVLIQLGEFDALFPAGLSQVELSLWQSTTPTIQTLAGIGHDFNLHLNHEEGWRSIDDWLKAQLSKP